VPWSNRLEPKEKEVPDDVLVVMMVPVETSDHVRDPKLLFCVLEQGDEGTLATVSQLA